MDFDTKRKTKWVMFMVVLLDLLGFGIVIPILPFLFTDPVSQYSLLPDTVSLQTGYILYGALVATYPIFQFLSAPVLGQLSDKYGRKPILLASLLGTSLSYLIFAYGLITANIVILFLSRAFDGLTGGNISVAQAVVADTVKPQERTKQFGLLGAGFGIGLVLGPYIGGKLADPSVVSWFSMQTPFWFAAFLAFMNVLAVLFILPETLVRENRYKDIHWLQSFRNIGNALHIKKMRTLFLSGFLFQCGFAFFTTFISVFLLKNFGFNQSMIGEFFAYAGIWIAFTQAFIVKIIHGKISDEHAVSYGLAGCALFIFILIFTTHVWLLLLITALFAIANGISQTSYIAIISKAMTEREQGKILGVNSSVIALGQAIPPFISGFIAASSHAEMPIIVAGIFITFAAVIYISSGSRERVNYG